MLYLFLSLLDLYEKINAVILIVLIEKYLVNECKHLALRDGPFDIRGGGGAAGLVAIFICFS